MEVGLIRSIDIDQTMQQAYLDYAMSVIVARALPDARDGLKPVHRRILYAMFDMGLRPDTAYKKSARIVGEVLGKYHPHGDMAVYESMARMAQDFSMRCLLVEGQGNFGSVDGDPPAAMRYTEARLTAPSMELLADIRKNTVDFSDNFDGSLQEPDVLPAAIPNLLVNGATGIAVGMSTNIPPHNLSEVVDALIYMLENWDRLDDVNIENLMRFIQGPDFPTGGLIVQDTHEDDLTAAYGTGRGRVTVQSRCHIEEISRGRNRIIVTELPYMTNKSSLIERIAELARGGRLEGITDLRDESDRHGLRIVIELSRTAEPEKVLQDLYKNTPMRSTFGIIMLALVDGEPRMLSLKQALRVYLDHRLTVIRRQAEYELDKARQRAHILEGLRVALKHLDEIIELIKKSPDADIARDRLMKRYRLSEIQAQSILDMQLRRLAALERKKIEDEYKEVLAQIKALETLLRSPVKLRQTVATELHRVKEAYGDRRRTQITRLGAGAKSVLPVLSATDLLPEQTVWVSATDDGLISRTLDEKLPRISGSMAPRFLLQVNTRDTLFLVSDKGEAAGIPVQTLPEAENPQEGAPIHKVSALSEEARLASLFTLPPKEERLEGWYVFTATQQGMLKKTALEELPGPTGHSFTLVKVNEDDKLGWIRLTDGKAEILLVTADGMAIRFHEDEVRPMGLVAAGVGGIKLGARDVVIGMEIIPRRGDILLLTSDGKAKRVTSDQFPHQGRYGQGVIAWKLPRTAQLVGIAAGKATTRLTILLDKLSPKAIRFDEAPQQNRTASGKTVVELKPGYQVLGLSVSWVVPRAIVGEKITPEKEPEVPEEPEEPQPPEVEQLTFGMIEPAVQVTSKAVKSKSGLPRTENKQKTKPAPRKSKPPKASQATLITKVAATKKESAASRASRQKSLKSVTAGKKTATAKSEQAQLIDQMVPVKKASPIKKRGRPISTKEIPTKQKMVITKTRSLKPTIKTTKKVEKKPASKASKTGGITKSAENIGRKPAAKAGKPGGITKSAESIRKKPAAKISKPRINTKAAVITDRKPITKVGRSGSVKAIKSRAKQTKPAKEQAAGFTPKKSVSRKPRQKKVTIKSATAASVVILPPSWKPKRSKTSPTRRIVKSTKPS
jgi:DNA gyrase subunit A